MIRCILLSVALSQWVQGPSALADPPTTALVVTPDHQQLVAGSQAGITLFEIAHHAKLRSIATTLEQVHDLSFSPDGRYLLAVGGTPAESGIAELFSWPEGIFQQRFTISDDLLYRAVWSSDSSWFATCGQGHDCSITSLPGQQLARYTGHSRPVLAMTYLAKEQQLITAGMDNTIQLWSTAGQRLRALTNHTGTVTDLAARTESDGTVLLVSTSEDRTVRLWQPAIGRMVKFVRLDAIPRRVNFGSDKQLFAACDDGTLYEINSETMQVLTTRKCNLRPTYELTTTASTILLGGNTGLEFLPKPK